MNNKMLKLYSKLGIILPLISFFAGVIYLILVMLNVVEVSNPDGEGGLGEGIALALGLVIFVMYLIGQAIVCIYMIIEGRIIGREMGEKQPSRKLLIIGGIIKTILAAVSVYFGILFVSVGLLFCGISVFFFTAVLLLIAILGFVISGKVTIK